MLHLSRNAVVLLVLLTPICLAQKWEIGGAGGYAFAKDNEVTNASGSADAGFKSSFLASAVASHHMFRHLSGEIRYLYRKGNPRVKSAGARADFAGESHAVHYDFLLHTSPKEAKVRPFVAFGGGVKVFRGTGVESAFQPLGDFALLTKTSETLPLLSVGGGVSVALSTHVVLRLEFRDHITPFPQQVIAPAPEAKLGGFLHDFLPMVGIGLKF